ncbi:MAG TPA: S46 family peptidase, partial [Longimicrobiales bacterium]
MSANQRRRGCTRRDLAFALVLLLAGGSYAAAQQATAPSTARARANGLDTVRAGRYDGGKMWPFEYPPSAYFTQTYGFQADAGWFERARLGALRTAGCSAAFVSQSGLVITNHHCARGGILEVQKAGEHLLDTGFFASSLAEERRLPRFWVEQLIAVHDVSDEVFRALEGVSGDSLRGATRERSFAAIRQRMQAQYAGSAGGAATIEPEIVALYHGGRYSAYVFKRYTDVRLVAAPEEQMGFFGGDPDNYTYPRYDLDFSLLRVYDGNGKPIVTASYFRFSPTGVRQGDAVFVIGNPGPTSRGLTLAQLEFQRDVELPPRVAALRSRLAALRAELGRQPTGPVADQLRNSIFGISNALKGLDGGLSALHDPLVMARRADAEKQFRAAIQQKPELSARYAGLFDQIEALQREKARLAPSYAAFAGLMNTPTGAVMDRALQAIRLLG